MCHLYTAIIGLDTTLEFQFETSSDKREKRILMKHAADAKFNEKDTLRAQAQKVKAKDHEEEHTE